MDLDNILTLRRTRCGVHATSKKRLLEEIARFISEDIASLDADELFAQLLARERLGSTGLGHGVAVPHCRVANCSSIIGALFTLDEVVDFEAADDEPVDVLFALIVPEDARDEHLKALATIAGLFNQPEYRERLRRTRTDEELYQAAIEKI